MTFSILWGVSSARSGTSDFAQSRASGVPGLDYHCTKSSMQIRSSIQSVAAITPLAGDVIAALSSQVSVRLRLAIDASRTLKRLASRIFPRRTGTFCRGTNFRRAFEAAGKPSFRTLFQSPEKPLSVASIFYRPRLSLLAVHVVNSSSGVGECPTKEFPKPENEFPRIA